ncbi:MAG: ubiquinol-cytochrome c reductase iron-sulfur subunit [Thermoplasmata archaeon]
MSQKSQKGDTPADQNRRAFIKGAALSVFSLAIGGVSLERFFVPTTRNVPVSAYSGKYPPSLLVDPSGNPIKASQIPYATPDSSSYPILVFNYPLQDEPNILLRLRNIKVPDAIYIPNATGGTDSITAYSGICQHLGCTVPLLDYHPGKSIPFEAQLVGYTAKNWPEYGLIYCKCHGSQYDPVKGPHNLYDPSISPANHSLPQVIFTYDESTDYLYAVNMNPVNAVIRGHLWNSIQNPYGSQVEEENLSGGDPLPYDENLRVYKSVVVSSTNANWPGRF